MQTRINIKGLDKAEVLVALYNYTKLRSISAPLSKEEAQKALDEHPCWAGGPAYSIDYLNAVAMKVLFKGDYLFLNEYASFHGQGTAEKAIERLRKGDLSIPPSMLPTFLGLFETSYFDNTPELKKKFTDSDFVKIDVPNSRRDGYDFSSFKEGETLIAICTDYGKESVLYEHYTSDQVKETRFDTVHWYIRKRNNPTASLQQTAPEAKIDQKSLDETNTMRPW